MNTTTAAQQGKQGKWSGNPIVTARNAVTTLLARTKQKLFGGMGALNGRTLRGEVEIPDGNVSAFFEKKVGRYGIADLSTKGITGTFDAVVGAIATKIAARTKADIGEDQLQRVALEYVLQSAFLQTDKVQPFAEYLVLATQFRKAVKAVNAAARASSDEAFGTNGTDAKRLNTEGRKGWEDAIALLTSSTHLRTLRTTIAAPILYADDAAWDACKAMERQTRLAVTAELQEMAAERGNPIVGQAEVTRAQARIAGNTALTNGSAYGVNADAVVAAVAATPFGNARNGGPRAQVLDASPSDIGMRIAGLRGIANTTAERVDEGKVRFTIEVRDAGPLPTGTMVPFAFSGPQQHATA